MEKRKMEELLAKGAYKELIEKLEEEDYDEYSMLTLSRSYLCIGDVKNAKKVIRKLKILFPAGEFLQEENRLFDAIEKEQISDYLESLTSFEKKQDITESAVCDTTVKKQDNSLSAMLKQSEEMHKMVYTIPENIKECFKDVVGMESVQIKLDHLYKLLRFQHERKEKSFHTEVVHSTHFVIAGSRGCGKTVVAQIIAGLLCDFGLRKNREIEYVDAEELLKYIESHMQLTDAIVVVENMHLWMETDTEIFSKNIRILETFMKEKKNTVSFILTGSFDFLHKMLAVNETVVDVFQSIIEIPEYTTEELLSISKKIATQMGMRLHPTAETVLLKKLSIDKKNTDFMNGITIRRYFEQAVIKMAARFFEKESDSEADLVYIMPEDLQTEIDGEGLSELLDELDKLTGLHAVKEQIRKRIATVQVDEMAQRAGAERETGHGTLHMLFTGNPGTGKTTVARLLGKIYQQLGILPKGNIMVECTRSDLVGQYQGHTAKQVRDKVRAAMGGVLFIDEAYALCRNENDSFGKEAVDELIAAMENNKDNMMVILAGYKKEMDSFMKTNSGFPSRIRNTIEFEDYTVEEMVDIFQYMVKDKQLRLEEGAEKTVYQMLECKSKKPDFGNARGVRNVFEELMEIMNERLIAEGTVARKESFDVITIEDIENAANRKLESEKTLDELLDELNSMTGLQSVKDKVQEMVDEIQVREYMKQQSMDVTDGHGTLHLVFKGNAGTGKTTVARLLGKIYRKLGILKKNVFIECGRKDLVANYMGQTATTVIQKVEEADGGILFIDEAYNLCTDEHDIFGKEAVDTLLAELENRRGSLMVILAGYEKEMEHFLEINQGLSSRLSNEIVFEDYTSKELVEIFKYMIKEKKLLLPENADELILQKIEEEKVQKKDFGNARGVRNILDKIIKRKNSRIAKIIRNGETLSNEEMLRIEKEDFV